MAKHCEDAQACKKTGEWLCNYKGSKNHPGTCCMKSCPLSVIHCLSCCAVVCSNDPYEIAIEENRLDDSWSDIDPCYKDGCHCYAFLYHTIVCSLCLPFMVLGLLGGTFCYCVGRWNEFCGCDERCCKKNAVQPIMIQPTGQAEPHVWTTEESGHLTHAYRLSIEDKANRINLNQN